MRCGQKHTGLGFILLQGLLVTVAVGIASSTGLGAAFTDGEVLTLGNEYIVIGVNVANDATGRFALETTGGDPAKPDDDYKPLVYGRPRPWTSYTTVRLDDKDYVFGGKTERRAGQQSNYGQVSQVPQRNGDAILTATVFGAVEVTQSLALAKSSTTGLLDTMRVTYMVENKDTAEHTVGLRIMLDTMLGDNDGAPFRIGEDAVTGDSAFAGVDLPEFWQAFDSLQAPSVTAQGVLSQKSVTRPDRVLMSNWGSLADTPWEADFVPGRDFTRSGEFELDSALALYWDPRPLAPGESRAYVTEYGLGGISVAPGLLALGLTAPSQVTADQAGKAIFPVVAYIESRGDAPAREVVATIQLPKGLEVVGGSGATRSLGDLSPGTGTQIMWQVASRDAAGQAFQVVVEATALNVEPNRVGRTVKVTGPPKLAVEVSELPEFKVIADRLSPERFVISGKIANAGAADAYLVRTTLEVPSGLSLAEFEKASKFIGALEPGATRTVQWVVVPAKAGVGQVRVTAESSNAPTVTREGAGSVPALEPRIVLRGPDGTIKVGRYFRVDVAALNIDQLDAVQFDLKFDPKILAVLGVSRGDRFVATDGRLLPFGLSKIDNVSGVVSGITGKTDGTGPNIGTLATVHLVAVGTGTSSLGLDSITLFSRNQDQSVSIEASTLSVVAP